MKNRFGKAPPQKVGYMKKYEFSAERIKKGSRNGENLTQCRDLQADQSIREAAITKHDTRLIVVVSRELVAAEA